MVKKRERKEKGGEGLRFVSARVAALSGAVCERSCHGVVWCWRGLIASGKKDTEKIFHRVRKETLVKKEKAGTVCEISSSCCSGL